MSAPQQHNRHPLQRTPYRPQDGLGPVQALAQAYHRTHARTQSAQLPSASSDPDHHGYNHSNGPPKAAQFSNRPPRPPSSLIPGSQHGLTALASTSATDELVHSFSRLGNSSSITPGALQGAATGASPPSPLKPLPSLPPARTPSQHRHQQQNQQPYTPYVSSSPSLPLVQERPRSESRPPAYVPFPSPLRTGAGLPDSSAPRPQPMQHVGAARPAPAPTSQGTMPLPRPPIQFPEPRAHMRPPTNLTPPHLPGQGPVRPESSDSRTGTGPVARPPLSTMTHEHRPQLPTRPHSDQLATRPSAAASASPSSSVVQSTLSPRPQHPHKKSSSSNDITAQDGGSHSGTESPGRTVGLRQALPPPLPGQCWGIKRDGTRCTRKVGKSGSNTPSSSPRRTSPTKNVTSQHTGSSPSVQKKSPHSRRVAGASRGRPIILSSDSEEEDDDNDDDSWIVHDSSDDAEYRTGNRSSAQRRTEHSLASASNLLLPPETEGRRRHRRSRSAGAEQPPLLDHARLGPNSRSHSDNGHWLDVESFTSTDDDEERGGGGSSSRTGQRLVEPAYCFQHISEINKSPGFYISRNHHHHTRTEGQRINPSSSTDDYVAFVEYLRGPSGALLGQQAQASLRSVMSAALTAADVRGLEGAGRNGRRSPQGQPSSRGYMYIYELRAFSTSTEVCLKVGRTSNVFRRMAEWKGRCRRRGAGLVLIGFEPSPQSNDHTSSAVSSARGRPTGGGTEAPAQGLIGGAAEVWCEGIYGSHKWERLTHLELLDIGRRLDEGPCEDCGARHREIFMIPRDIGQGNTNAIEAVREIVRKWEGFVRRLVGEE